MKALSLWQPWASLWACGRKTFETRHWSTNYRGPLAIHAAQKLCVDINDELREICDDEFGGHWARELPSGALVAHCTLVNCLATDHLHVDQDERAQGNFTPGRFAWDISNLKLLDRPIPYRGHQSLFDIPDEIITGASPPPKPQGGLF
jgi:hypothetical protein